MPEDEPFFVPLAVHLLAGHSALEMLILLARSQPERFYEWLVAVLGAWGNQSDHALFIQTQQTIQ